jgi:hypothetical protein
MTALREQEIERRLEQSKRLLNASGSDDYRGTGKMIGELEQEKELDKEKYSAPTRGAS